MGGPARESAFDAPCVAELFRHRDFFLNFDEGYSRLVKQFEDDFVV